MLNLWRNLVNTESGTTQIDGVNAVCSILRREMENAGIHTRVRAIQNSGEHAHRPSGTPAALKRRFCSWSTVSM